MSSRDHETVEDFVRALAKARMHKSHPLGFEDSLPAYWQEEAKEWVKEFDKLPDPCYCNSDEECNCER